MPNLCLSRLFVVVACLELFVFVCETFMILVSEMNYQGVDLPRVSLKS